MPKFDIAGLGHVSWSHDSHSFDVEGQGYYTLADLIQKVGGVVAPDEYIQELMVGAIEMPDWERDYYRSRIDQYVRRSGRKIPPVYRVRLALEVEVVDDATASTYWARHRRRVRGENRA